MSREGRLLVLTTLVSLAVHAGVIGGVRPARASTRPPLRFVELVGVEPWPASPTAPASEMAPTALPASARPPTAPGGPRSTQNVEGEKPGGGGERIGAAEFVLLVSDASPVLLVDRARNALVSQISRIDTDRARGSRWDTRSTPNPSHEAFLASGEGRRPERRPVSSGAPRRGADTTRPAGAAGSPGAALAASARTGGSPAHGRETEGLPTEGRLPPAASPTGRPAASQGPGAVDSDGRGTTRAADVATGRPEVDRGVASVPARVREPRPRDRVDSESLAAPLVRAWIDSSPREGSSAGSGEGGSGLSGPPGSGHQRIEGGRAAPSSPGPGSEPALSLDPARYRTWHTHAVREIDRHLEYPRARRLARDQGDVVYRVTLRRDGTLVGAPRLLRSSGFEDLDRAAREAIVRARFAALPADLAPESPRIAVTFPVRFVNPMSY
ncbi:MAG: TonB family protein [Polyangiales bacterium]